MRNPVNGIIVFKINTRFKPPASLDPSRISHDWITIPILIYIKKNAIGKINNNIPIIEI